LPDHERYRLGGAQTLRGFKDGEFVGDSMMLVNAEYRIPVADNFDGVLFADIAKDWEEEADLSLDSLNESVGLGVRVKTPVGQLRLDYGFQIQREDEQEKDSRLHFSLGQSF
jgi:outer membrane protein insertion porin family